jgi:hydrogenase/urease accessory protein HupE
MRSHPTHPDTEAGELRVPALHDLNSRRATRRHALGKGLAPLLAICFLAWPAPAHAHDITADAKDRSIFDFLPLGIEHMMLGWDHLLFIAGVMLVAKNAWRSAKLISLFVLGHSSTLIIATVAEWQVNADVVDVVIALSVVFVGVMAFLGKEPNWTWFGSVILGFGLVHGLGLSTRLQELGLPDDGLIWRVLAFNVGIEIGQLTAIVGMLALGGILAMAIKEHLLPGAATALAACLAVGGVAAGVVAVVQDDDTEDERVVVSSSEACTVEDRTQDLPAGGGHAAKAFYEPEEQTPLDAFGHSVGDGYVAVLYARGIERRELDALRDYVASEDGQGVLAGAFPEDGGFALSAITADGKQLNCSDLDLDALSDYRTEWFDSLR